MTGNDPSDILGKLGVSGGNANLFLINPNGIIFGPNASLDVGGSFVATTANAIQFGDQGFFNASVPNVPSPLLTVNPSAFLFNQITAGSIENRSTASAGLDPSGSFDTFGLRVPDRRSLLLVGGNVSIDSGGIAAFGGRVDLGGVAGAGTVGLNLDDNNLLLSFPNNTPRADVSLTNGAGVIVAAGSGGSIAVNSRNIDVLGGSVLHAGIGLSLGSVGTQGGDIEINATGAIKLTNGSQIVNSTFGQGNAGNVTITALGRISFDGEDSNGNSSGVFSQVVSEAVGKGGDINVTTGSLSLTNGADLGTSTFGRGDAGSVRITASGSVSFDGVSSNGFSTGAFSNVEFPAVGKGGDVNVTTGSLSLTNGAVLSAGTFGRGDAGSVTITASGPISFNGVGSNGVSSGAFSTVDSEAVGNGGGINITAGSLSVTDGATLSASSEGSGAAGNIEVAAPSIRLDNQAIFSSDTKAGQGNIILRSQDLVLRRESSITTNATATASGGNITIDTDFIAALENSDISANSANLRGGQVRINAQGIFGTQFRLAPTKESDITATGGSPEFSGTVEINTPDIDPSRGLVNLPAELVDASNSFATGCTPGGRQGESKFVITGRGGLPSNPSEALSSDAIQVDWVTLNLGVENSSSPPVSTNPTAPAPDPIVEARGWVINNKREVVLTATAPTTTPHIPWMTQASCHAPGTSS